VSVPENSAPTALAEARLACAACGWAGPLAGLAWRCPNCRGVLDLAGTAAVMPGLAALRERAPSLWRYREALPVAEVAGLSMGEGMTPLLDGPGRPGVAVKVDYLMPTGSFKDRGAVLLATLAARLGVAQMVADSSGNAGSAIAAYATRAGIGCDVYVPASTSAGKLAQLDAYGARVHRVAGTREDTAAAAAEAADEPGVFYASHVYNPVFLHGTKTYAFEIWEQLGGRLPEVLLLPVGNGTLVLGCYLGCRELLAAGLIDRLPRIVAIQAAGCAPLAAAMRSGAAAPGENRGVSGSGTVAEGIAIAQPARGAQILAAVRDTGGDIVTVTDDQTRAACAELARAGLYVEPTSGVCWAALRAGLAGPVPGPGPVPYLVAPLCGTGLKSHA
jgi:threonine synthase